MFYVQDTLNIAPQRVEKLSKARHVLMNAKREYINITGVMLEEKIGTIVHVLLVQYEFHHCTTIVAPKWWIKRYLSNISIIQGNG